MAENAKILEDVDRCGAFERPNYYLDHTDRILYASSSRKVLMMKIACYNVGYIKCGNRIRTKYATFTPRQSLD